MDRYDVIHLVILSLSVLLAYVSGMSFVQGLCMALLIIVSIGVGSFEVLYSKDLTWIAEKRKMWAKVMGRE